MVVARGVPYFRHHDYLDLGERLLAVSLCPLFLVPGFPVLTVLMPIVEPGLELPVSLVLEVQGVQG